MSYRINCRGCQRRLRIADTLVDKIIQCPQCERRIILHSNGARVSTAAKRPALSAPTQAEQETPKPTLRPMRTTAARTEVKDPPSPKPMTKARPPKKEPPKPTDMHDEPVPQPVVPPPARKLPTPIRPAKKAAAEEGEGIPKRLKLLIGGGVAIILLIFLAWFFFGGSSLAQVTGKVTYKNEVVDTGQIHFIGEGGVSRSSPIGTDGTYQLVDCPPGKFRVSIIAEKVKAPPPGKGNLLQGAVKPQSQPVAVSLVPRKYNRPETSDLSYTLDRGRQTINIELKD